MADSTDTSNRQPNTAELDDEILADDDYLGTFTMDFYEFVDNLVLGYTDLDVHGVLAQLDVTRLDKKDVHALLVHISGLGGEKAQRVALVHILLERGDLDAKLLEQLVNHSQIGDVQITDPQGQGRNTD